MGPGLPHGTSPPGSDPRSDPGAWPRALPGSARGRLRAEGPRHDNGILGNRIVNPFFHSRSAVAADRLLHARQALAQVIGSHDRHELDLGADAKEETLSDIGNLR
jgi:hypothetical protein